MIFHLKTAFGVLRKCRVLRLVRLALCVPFLFAMPSFCGAADIDFSRLLELAKLGMGHYVVDGATGRPLYDIDYADIGAVRRAVLGVDVPCAVRVDDLRITVYAKNMTLADSRALDCRPPFSVTAAPFALKISGRKTVLGISADKAVLNSDASISLYGNVRISVGGAAPAVGRYALLCMKENLLCVKNGKKEVRFRLFAK